MARGDTPPGAPPADGDHRRPCGGRQWNGRWAARDASVLQVIQLDPGGAAAADENARDARVVAGAEEAILGGSAGDVAVGHDSRFAERADRTERGAVLIERLEEDGPQA